MLIFIQTGIKYNTVYFHNSNTSNVNLYLAEEYALEYCE